jgi:hypothetical protein
LNDTTITSIFFPSGTYLTTGDLTITNKAARLHGEGTWRSIIRKTGGTTGQYTVKFTGTDYHDHLSVEGLSFHTTGEERDKGLYASWPEADIQWNRSQTRCRIINCEFAGYEVTAAGHSVGDRPSRGFGGLLRGDRWRQCDRIGRWFGFPARRLSGVFLARHCPDQQGGRDRHQRRSQHHHRKLMIRRPGLSKVRKRGAAVPAIFVPLFEDNFDGRTENLSANANWTLVSGLEAGATASNGMLNCANADSTGTLVHSPDHGSAAQYAECTLPNFASAFVVLRASDANSYVAFRRTNVGGDVHVFRKVSTTFTQLLAFPGVAANGEVIRVALVGNTVTVYRDGSPIVATGQSSASVILNLTGVSASTRQGVCMRASSTNGYIDNYKTGIPG